MTPTPGALIQPYLFFSGRCEEALDFYRSTLGLQVEFMMRFNESPDPAPPGTVPPGFENKVLHATVRVGNTVFMASDGNCREHAFSGFRLSLTLPTPDEAARAFTALAEHGSVIMPLGKTFWSPCFGMLTDRFGLGWMITVPAPLPR